MFALLSDEELKEAYGDYRHRQGVEEGRKEGIEQGIEQGREQGLSLLSTAITRLVAGEAENALLADGITSEIINQAKELIGKIK